MRQPNNCLFLTDRAACLNPPARPHFFCSDHKLVFASLDNATLLEETARSMRAMTYVSKDKKITVHADPKLIDAFINRLHEVLSRGYSPDEALDAIGDVIQEKGVLDDQLREIGKDPKWKKFEKIVAGIHMLQFQGAEVKFDDHIVGKKSAGPRQIDVSIRFKQGFYDYLTIVECKDIGRKVEVKEVEAFSKKMEDVGARHGVMVSALGFQKGGIGTAEFDNIELFTLTEIKRDWTKRIKADVITLPWPAEVEFDYPYIDLGEIREQPIEEGFHDILFHRGANDPAIPLSKFLHDVITHVIEESWTVPCEVRVPFEPALLCKFPGFTVYCPVHAIVVHLEPSRFAFGTEIDIPPKLMSYRYSDLKGKNVHEFVPRDIPRI